MRSSLTQLKEWQIAEAIEQSMKPIGQLTQVTLLGRFFENFRPENRLDRAWRGFVCPKPDVVKTYPLVSR